MALNRLRSLLIIPVVFLTFSLFTGCENKQQTKEQPGQNVETQKQTTQETPKEEPKVTDVKGKYTGQFDQKSATLNITDQKEGSFKGNLSVNYRKVLKQDVEGEFDSKTMEFTMKDINPGKFQGTYKGKFSEDFSKLSGTFTLNSKGGSYTFNLKKK